MIKIKAELIEKDLGFREIITNVDRPLEGAVGYLGTEMHPNAKMSNAALMAIHEYGTEDSHIPERRPFRRAFDSNLPAYEKMARQLSRQIMTPTRRAARIVGRSVGGKMVRKRGKETGGRIMTPRKMLALLSEVALGHIKQAISDGLPPPNTESTIQRKGSSKPLIDTGELRNSLQSLVRDWNAR